MEDFEIISVGDEGNQRDNGGSSVSAAKLKANSKNAQRSTGPKTATGKNRSRMNAIKHGILASVTVVSDPNLESFGDFEELFHSLARDLEPVGKLEEMLVEKIAVCWWRQQRALRFEALMIQRDSENDPHRVRLRDERLQTLYKETYEIFKRHGIYSRKDKATPPVEASRTEVIHQPGESTRSYERWDAIQRELERDYFRLPDDRTLDRILRYETSIERQLVHAINQLERLQRARKGEHVPAPVTLQVSTDH